MPKSPRFVESYVKDHVGYIYLDDESSLNALTVTMARQLIDAFRAMKSANTRAVVLSGRGRFFCSGQNLKPSEHNPMLPSNDVLNGYYHPMLEEIRQMPCMVIAALNGPIVGFGVGIALSCDVVLASESSYLMLPFSRIGLIPDGGSTYLLVRALGRHAFMELFTSCKRLPVGEMHRLGLVNEVYSDDAFWKSVTGYAETVAKGPVQAFALGKRLAWQAQDASYVEQLHFEAQAQDKAWRGDEAREGMQAFLHKRRSKF